MWKHWFMTIEAIRERLYDYLKVADDKKIEAIYTLLENDIMEYTEWWNDESFIKELDKEYIAWENGSEKGYTLEEIEGNISALKSKRQKHEL